GQVKEAFALAQACATIGPSLHPLFTQAFAVAKRVRNETEIARHAVSVAFAAVELAKKIFAGLARKAVLLGGAGKAGERAARRRGVGGAGARRRGDPHDRLPARAAGRDPTRRASQGARAPGRRAARDAPGARGPVVRDRQQDSARADHEASRVVARGRAPHVAGARARALRAHAEMIRLATRGSVLALAQAALVAEQLRVRGEGVEIVPIRTEGDRLAEARLATLGGKGLFIRELEQALVEGRVDCAVHSLKDLPAALPAGLVRAAFPPRETP